jgi:hypothetical protein
MTPTRQRLAVEEVKMLLASLLNDGSRIDQLSQTAGSSSADNSGPVRQLFGSPRRQTRRHSFCPDDPEEKEEDEVAESKQPEDRIDFANQNTQAMLLTPVRRVKGYQDGEDSEVESQEQGEGDICGVCLNALWPQGSETAPDENNNSTDGNTDIDGREHGEASKYVVVTPCTHKFHLACLIKCRAHDHKGCPLVRVYVCEFYSCILFLRSEIPLALLLFAVGSCRVCC